MYTSGQTINYEKYIEILNTMPAPILGSQLPDAQLDLTGLMEYACKKGVKAGSLSDEEKNLFIKAGQCPLFVRNWKTAFSIKTLLNGMRRVREKRMVKKYHGFQTYSPSPVEMHFTSSSNASSGLKTVICISSGSERIIASPTII